MEKEDEKNLDTKGGVDSGGKYVRYTNEQVEALERVYNECPKPSAARRTQLIKENLVLSNIEAKQIKVWFQNRRCRERQRLESNRLQSMNQKLAALNKILVEENDLKAKQIQQLTVENALLRSQLSKIDNVSQKLDQVAAQQRLGLGASGLGGSPHSLEMSGQSQGQGGAHVGLRAGGNGGMPASLDNSQESAVTDPHAAFRPAATNGPEASTSGLLTIAEEILVEFLAKATGNSMEFVDMPGTKAKTDFMGRVTIGNGGPGVVARAAGLIALDPYRVAELLKDRMQWMRDCRRCDVLGGFRTPNGGSVQLIYTQMYAPTTLAPPRDFCTLRYTSPLDDGGVVVCERSLTGAHGGATMPAVPAFVRAEMLPSGYLIRPFEGGGCVIIIVDHMDLEPWSVPEVLRPSYESSAALAQRVTIEALRYLRRVAQEGNVEGPTAQQQKAWRAISERIAMGFNEAVNAFADDGWEPLVGDGLDDVSIAARATGPGRAAGSESGGPQGAAGGGGVLCAKASMLLQNVPPSLLINFLRTQRAEWAGGDIDPASPAAAVTASIRGSAGGDCPPPMPLAYSIDNEETLELVKLTHSQSLDANQPRETFLLQLCSGTDELGGAATAQLVFAPVDAASTADSVPLLPSGFRVIPLDGGPPEGSGSGGGGLGRTRDLASSLEGQSEGGADGSAHWRSVLTIAFQFAFDAPGRDSVAAVARQYVRYVVSSVQRVAMALAPGRGALPPPLPPPAPRPLSVAKEPNNTEAALLACRILHCYRVHMGMDLVADDPEATPLKLFWEHPDAIICVAWKPTPEMLFANRAGLDLLETTSAELQDVEWDKTYDDDGRKAAYAAFSQVMQQGCTCLPPGVRISRSGRAAGYERAVAWKVVDEDDNIQCIAFTHIRWAFLS